VLLIKINVAEHIHSHGGKCHLLASIVDRLLFWVLWPFGYMKVEPLAFSSDCISVDENAQKLAFFVLGRMK